MAEYTHRLSQADILEACQIFLRQSGMIPSDSYVVFRYKFGLVGDPVILACGEESPDVGDIYIDWSIEPLDNVKGIRDSR